MAGRTRHAPCCLHYCRKKGNTTYEEKNTCIGNGTAGYCFGVCRLLERGRQLLFQFPSQQQAPQPQSSSKSFQHTAAGVDLQAIVDKINEEIGIAMPTEMDEEMLVQAFNLNADDFEQVAAVGTMINTKVNNVVVVKAKEGKADAVKASLEAKLEQLTQNL